MVTAHGIELCSKTAQAAAGSLQAIFHEAHLFSMGNLLLAIDRQTHLDHITGKVGTHQARKVTLDSFPQASQGAGRGFFILHLKVTLRPTYLKFSSLGSKRSGQGRRKLSR